jgi:primosomal replication protein N
MNEVVMSGVIHGFHALRYTPAGVPVAEFCLRHTSTQQEAGRPRSVALDLKAIAFGVVARRLANELPQGEITARGFLAARSQRSTEIVLHANTIETHAG